MHVDQEVSRSEELDAFIISRRQRNKNRKQDRRVTEIASRRRKQRRADLNDSIDEFTFVQKQVPEATNPAKCTRDKKDKALLT